MKTDDIISLKGQPLLVSGATGFIGLHLTKALITAGAKVRVLVRQDRKIDIVDGLKSLGAEIFYGDILDRESVYKAVRGCEYVFHLAALIDDFTQPEKNYHATNVDGTENIFAAAEEYGVKRVIHCSTVGVYGDLQHWPASETEPFRPNDIYQATKCKSEDVAKRFAERGCLEVVVIRPAMVWGEGDKRTLKLFKRVANRSFPRIGDWQTLTHWLHVTDLVDGFILAALAEQAAGQTYNLAGKRAVSIDELVSAISEKAGVGPSYVSLPLKPIYAAGFVAEMVCLPFKMQPPITRRQLRFFTQNKSFNTTKAEKELGFQPKMTFEQEVSSLFDWHKENGLL